METVFKENMPEMVKTGTKGGRGIFARIATSLLLAANGLSASPVDLTFTDCDRKSVEEIYGSYVYDRPRFRPLPPMRLSVEESYRDYEHIEEPQADWLGLAMAEAELMAGREVYIEPTRYREGEILFVDPYYEMTCYRTFVEGHVPGYKWSNEFGFGVDRDVIHVLRVYSSGNPTDPGLPDVTLEIVGGDLWRYDNRQLFIIQQKENSR